MSHGTLKVFVMFVLGLQQAWADPGFHTERQTGARLISVQNMRCQIPLGVSVPVEERMMTILDEVSGLIANGDNSLDIELEHRFFSMKGCDFLALDEIVSNSFRRFGFADAQVTAIKEVAKEASIRRGQCSRTYRESLDVDLGKGIILETPKAYSLKSATGCAALSEK